MLGISQHHGTNMMLLFLAVPPTILTSRRRMIYGRRLAVRKVASVRQSSGLFRWSWKNYWTDFSQTYGQILPSHCQALHLAIFGAKVLSADSKITRLIKKDETRRAWQSQTWGRPAPQVRVQNQFQEDEISLAVMAGRMKKFSENTSTIQEVMESSTLNFKTNFKFSWFFWGPRPPSGVC